jgi:hypothetical protein
MQTSSFVQQPASPQQVSDALQHLPPQHRSPCSQQPFPQHVCVDLQQCSPQHVSGFLPPLQQSRPQVSVPLGHRQSPLFGLQTFAGGQHRPAQQLSSGAQQLERLSF